MLTLMIRQMFCFSPFLLLSEFNTTVTMLVLFECRPVCLYLITSMRVADVI